MKLIAHRGNLFGPNPVKENTVDYIEQAIAAGYDCEIDVWFDEGYYLGHDKPENMVEEDWLKKHRKSLWIHCKNLMALEVLSQHLSWKPNCFWHEDDHFTITSKGWIWAHPKSLLEIGSWGNTIAVLPERNDSLLVLNGFGGICSDYIGNYNDKTGSI